MSKEKSTLIPCRIDDPVVVQALDRAASLVMRSRATDYRTLPDRYLKDVRQVVEAASGYLQNPRDKELFENRAAPVIAQAQRAFANWSHVPGPPEGPPPAPPLPPVPDHFPTWENPYGRNDVLKHRATEAAKTGAPS